MAGSTFSREAEAILKEARNLAKSTGVATSSAHILLALFTVPNQAQHYLRERAIDEDALLARLSRLEAEAPGIVESILRRAERLAEGAGGATVTSLHLLSALVGFKDSLGYRLLNQIGVDMAQLRTVAMSFFLADDVPRRFRLKPSAGTPELHAESPRINPDPIQPNTSTIGFHPGLQVRRRSPHPPTATAAPTTKTEKTPQEKGKKKDAPPDQIELAKRLFGGGRTGKRPARSTESRSNQPHPISSMSSPSPASHRAEPRTETRPATSKEASLRFELPAEEFPCLTQFGRNLTAEAACGQVDTVIGREKEIWQLVDILNKRRSNNPILVGDPGVGKTAIALGLASLLTSDQPPEGLKDRILIELEAGRLLSGTGLRGSLAERLIALREEVEKAKGRVIVLLDEIHRWIGTGSGGDGPDGTGELKPALARGSFPCIGTTTHDEYRRCIANDPAFARRFQLIRVEEPTVEQTVAILVGVRDRYTEHHGVSFSDKALEAAARLSHRYIGERSNPDKALGVLDLAGSKARRQGLELVDETVVAEVVGEMAGIPPAKLLMSDRERFLAMEEYLMKSIVGHERNLARIAHVLRRNYAGFVSGRPIGSFLFLGPTGVGKTETAKVLADFLFQSRDAVTALDMSEFGEAHSVSRLIGSPPGYVGFDAGGQLTEAVRRYPYQIVLFDEIEKANQAVLNLLLQILEEGRLTDSRGQVVDLCNTVVIMTSNLGGEEATETQGAVGFGRSQSEGQRGERVLQTARRALPPELWNRIDEPLVFEPLTRPQVERIAHLQLQQSSQRLLEEKGIGFAVTPAVVDFLIRHGGYDTKLGARPLRRAVERYVEGPIADLILRGDVLPPAQIQVEVEGEELVFEVS
ncbi:MAG: AAA family ATPase [Bradymonadales bacterium]|nr:AAA family ATPase [Bradymonadales bacterium]